LRDIRLLDLRCLCNLHQSVYERDFLKIWGSRNARTGSLLLRTPQYKSIEFAG
jgi:hypothetical protein